MVVCGARRLAVVLSLLVVLSACSGGQPLPEVDVAAAAEDGTPPADDAVLVEGTWPDVAAYVAGNAAEGRGTVVNIFASWCRPCERELPLLLETSLTTPDVAWLGIASEDRERDAVPFVERLGVHWPTVLDRRASTHIALEGAVMPTTAFFDDTGALVSVVLGEMDEERLEAELAALGR